MAEFVEVMRQRKRMCKAMGDICLGCELYKVGRSTSPRCVQVIVDNPDRAETIIMDWAAKHPEKTMKDVFFEMFPNAVKMDDGRPGLCLKWLGFTPIRADCSVDCADCWNQPAPEE